MKCDVTTGTINWTNKTKTVIFGFLTHGLGSQSLSLSTMFSGVDRRNVEPPPLVGWRFFTDPREKDCNGAPRPWWSIYFRISYCNKFNNISPLRHKFCRFGVWRTDWAPNTLWIDVIDNIIDDNTFGTDWVTVIYHFYVSVRESATNRNRKS